MISIRKIFITVYTLIIIAQFVSGQEYELVWSDEFDSTSLNTAIWQYEVNGDGGGNNELQYYTNRPENLEVKDGFLNIIALEEQYLGKNYTSARINTNGKFFFQYGKIEARMKMPYGQGIWPALWMLGKSYNNLGWPDCGEIDIMEMIGGEENENTIHSTLHWGPMTNGSHPNYGQSYTLSSGIFADDFHVIEMEWNENVINTSCDGALYYSIDITPDGLKAFHNPFFLIINLAVGGNWPGPPDATTIFPQVFQIDYIRLYQTPDMLILNNPFERSNNQSLIVYPNPFNDLISLDSSKPISAITIQDYTGQILYAVDERKENQCQFATSNLTPGLYILYIMYVDGSTDLVKLMK